MNFEVCIPSYHGLNRWEEVDAHDAEDAAKEAIREYNESDCTQNDFSIWVLVREVGSERVIICSASAEPDIHYSATEQSYPILCKQCGKDCRYLILNGEDLYQNYYCSIACHKAWSDEYVAKYRNNKKE